MAIAKSKAVEAESAKEPDEGSIHMWFLHVSLTLQLLHVILFPQLSLYSPHWYPMAAHVVQLSVELTYGYTPR